MAVQKINPVLVWKKKNLELPAIPDKTPQEMLDHYSTNYPELATATIGNLLVSKEGKMYYEIEETLGTKG